MVSPSAGSVVLVSFPFSDLSASKLRPAIVIACAGRDDWILCQVTSNPYADANAVEISDAALQLGLARGAERSPFIELRLAPWQNNPS